MVAKSFLAQTLDLAVVVGLTVAAAIKAERKFRTKTCGEILTMSTLDDLLRTNMQRQSTDGHGCFMIT